MLKKFLRDMLENASELCDIQEFSEAIILYDKILDIDVTNPEVWNLKGLVHYEQKKYSQALDAVDKAIESDPTYGMACF